MKEYDLINRVELLNHLNKCIAELGGQSMVVDTVLRAVKSAVEEMPTVDAVEVVRCIDCKYHEDEEPGVVYCPHIIGGWVTNDFFCAEGERKNDD